MEHNPLQDLAGRRVTRRQALQGAAIGGTTLGLAGLALTATAGPAVADITFPALPSQPTADDAKIYSFLESLARAASVAYETAAASSPFAAEAQSETASVLREFGEHHIAQADAYGALAGKSSVSGPNATLLAELSSALAQAPARAGLLGVLSTMEQGIIGAGQNALGTVVGTSGASRIASVVATDGRHLVILGQLAGRGITDFTPTFESVSGAYTPGKYPAE